MDLIGGMGAGDGKSDGPELQPRQPRDRRALAVVAALLVLGGSAYFTMRRPAEDAPPSTFPERPLVLPPIASEGSGSGQEESRLYASPEPVERAMSLDEFIGSLETEAPEPIKAAARKAFEETPRIVEALNTFRKERGGGAPAAEFMRIVRPMAEFRQLMARFKADPGFNGAFMKLQQNPEVARALRGELPAAQGRAAPPRIQSGVSAFKPVGAHGGARADPTIPERWAAMGRSGADVAARGGSNPGPHQAGAAPETATPPASASAGPSAHDVAPKLATIKDQAQYGYQDEQGAKVRTLLYDYPCLEALDPGATDPRHRQNLQGLAQSWDIKEQGFWGACFGKNIYDKCVAASCNKTNLCAPRKVTDKRTGQTKTVGASLTCRSEEQNALPGCWRACMELHGLDFNELTCIKQVRFQPGCSAPKDIPQDVWNRNCVQPKANNLFTRYNNPPYEDACGVTAIDCKADPSHDGCRCANAKLKPPQPASATCGATEVAGASAKCPGNKIENNQGACVCPVGMEENPAKSLCEPFDFCPSGKKCPGSQAKCFTSACESGGAVDGFYIAQCHYRAASGKLEFYNDGRCVVQGGPNGTKGCGTRGVGVRWLGGCKDAYAWLPNPPTCKCSADEVYSFKE